MTMVVSSPAAALLDVLDGTVDFMGTPLEEHAATLQALVNGRAFAPELPYGEGENLPGGCIEFQYSGGASIGQGARSRGRRTTVRVDVKCYGSTLWEAERVHWAVYDVLTLLERTVVADTIIEDAVASGGPIPQRDPDTDWPYVLGVYDISVGRRR